MIPNCIWFFVPAPNDVLRTESATKIPDMIASISQVVMLIALCVLINNLIFAETNQIVLCYSAHSTAFLLCILSPECVCYQ